MTVLVPFAQLVSFGDMTFTGAGAPANVRVQTTAITATPSFDRPRSEHPSNPFGISQYGYSPGPFKGWGTEWTVTVVAGAGLSVAASCQAIEAAWNTWYALWVGTHTHNALAGVTGQVGYLVALDQSGASHQAEAELTDLPTDNQVGRISLMQLKLSFTLNQAWT